MSALSNQEFVKCNDFDPNLFVRNLCENKKIIISDYCEICFMEGWKEIVEEVITKISNFSIVITQISDAHAQLDISFNVMNKTKELIVWRAIENTRQKSRLLCASCGESTYEFRKKKKYETLCKTCIKNSSNKEVTGTWLDKY